MKFRNKFLKYVVHANEAAAVDDGEAASGTTGEDETANSESGAGGDGDKSAGYWPDDWQSQLSKGDEKRSNIAKRYTSPEAVFDALVSAQNKIRSGEYKAALPKDANEEELASWRKSNGIPEKASDYDLTFDSGLVIGEEDEEAISSFVEIAHSMNMTPDQVKAAIEWNAMNQENVINARLDADETQRAETLDELNIEWGGNFRRNVNMINSLFSQIPEEIREDLLSARLPDGSAMFNNVDILRGFAAIAAELNPAGIVVPPGGGDPLKGVNEEIESIEKTMRENRPAYNRDEKMQARYRELLAAREKMKDR